MVFVLKLAVLIAELTHFDDFVILADMPDKNHHHPK